MNQDLGQFTVPRIPVWSGLLVMLLTGVFVCAQKPKGGKPMVEIETSLGTMVVELEQEKAPESVRNFLQYVNDRFYDGTVFHRVIKNFMIQGGGFTAELKQKPTRSPILNEAKNGLKNRRGALAMARTGDPNSATSQFFINHRDSFFLDYPGQDGWGYAVFGRLVSGLDVLDKIAVVSTSSQGAMADVPTQPVLIKSIRRVALEVLKEN